MFYFHKILSVVFVILCAMPSKGCSILTVKCTCVWNMKQILCVMLNPYKTKSPQGYIKRHLKGNGRKITIYSYYKTPCSINNGHTVAQILSSGILAHPNHMLKCPLWYLSTAKMSSLMLFKVWNKLTWFLLVDILGGNTSMMSHSHLPWESPLYQINNCWGIFSL